MVAIENKIQWFEATLNDVCVKITDGAHLSPKSVANGMPMASVKDLTSYGINIDSCRQITKEDYDKLVRQGCQPLEGDVLIAKDGATALDTVCVVKKTSEVVLLSSVAILRPDRAKIDSLFLRYYLDSETTRSYMKGAYTTGAAIPRVVLKDFKLASIKFASLPIQRKIAAILSAYDDLIENNLRRIKILEEMAQNLYREWFVKFRFPGHEQARFVDSPLGMIPEGWEVKKLGECCELIMGQSPKSSFYNEMGEGLPFHQGVTNFGDRFPTDRVYCTVADRIAEANDIMLSVRAPVGRINIALHRLVLGRGVSAVRARDGHQNFLFHQLKEVFSEEDLMGNGAIFKAVTKSDLTEIQLLHPALSMVEEFDGMVHSVDLQIKVLTSKNKSLRRTREMLLPRLISGEVDVSELDIAIPEEAVA